MSISNRSNRTVASPAAVRRAVGIGLLVLLANPTGVLSPARCAETPVSATVSAAPNLHEHEVDTNGIVPVQGNESGCGHSAPATTCSSGVGCVGASYSTIAARSLELLTGSALPEPAVRGPASIEVPPDTPPPRR